MNIEELEDRIKSANYREIEDLVNSLTLEECIQVLKNGKNAIVTNRVAQKRKYSIDEIKILSEQIKTKGPGGLIAIINNYNLKTKEDLNSILSISGLSKEDKIQIILDKIPSLSEEDMVSFIDNYTDNDDQLLNRIAESTGIPEFYRQFLIKNSKYGAIFAKGYLKRIEYDFSLETDELYNICMERIAKSVNIDKEEMKYFICILGQKNPGIFATIDYMMLAPEFRQLYSLERSNKVSNADRLFTDNLVQSSITSFGNSPEKIEVLKELFSYINNNCADNWEAYVYLMANSFKQNKDFFNSLKINNAGKIFNDSDIKKIMAYCSISDRKYQISDISDIINLDKKRNDYITKIFSNPNAKEHDMQNALLEKKYGINIKYAEKLIDSFNLNGISVDLTIKEMFEDIKKILKMKDQELRDYEKETKLGEIINIIDLQKDLKNSFEKEYEKIIFKPSEDNYMKMEEGVKIYNAGVDFSMLVHSVGAIYQKEGGATDAEHWTRDTTGLDCFSASFVRNDCLGFCNIRTAVYGFSDLDVNWLLDMSDSDYNSMPHFANGLSQSVLSPFVHGIRMNPDEMVKNTGGSHDYNEFLMNKYSDGRIKKPDYIVFPCDDFEKDIVSENVLTKSEVSGKLAYQMALKAAKEYNIPIVVIERNKVLANEKAKIEIAKQKLYNLEEKDEKQIREYINNIITRYRTNFLGMNTFGETDETTEKYKDTGISIDNYITDCKNILEYAKYLEGIDEHLSEVVLNSFKDAIEHPPRIHQLSFGIDEELMQKYEEIVLNPNNLELGRPRNA